MPEVRFDTEGAQQERGIIIFSMEKETKIVNWEQDFFVHHRIASELKRVEFVSDRLSYIVMRGRWCNIIVLNVPAPSEEKSDDSKVSSYEELEQVFDHFPKYQMNMLLGDFNAKVWRERIFSNCRWEMRVYILIIMVMVLE